MAAKKRATKKAGKRTSSGSTSGSSAAAKPAKKKKAVAKATSGKAPVAEKVPAKKVAAKKATAPSKAAAPKAAAPKAAKPKVAAPFKTPASRAAAGKAAATKVPKPAATAAVGLGEGAQAPSFELPDHLGGTVSSAELSGQPYVLYFYPKDDTPGCTTQACGFRDSFPDFERAGVRVLGVSPDSVASHQRFVGKYGLPFTLLSDKDQSLASAYGVWALKKNYGREYMGIVRSTFLVDREGVVRKVWRSVRVNGHVSEVRAAAERLS